MLKPSFRTRDPLLGDIKANAIELSIIETPEMQRLRRLKQTGFLDMVYPGATHSRFSHSLGTMQISKEIFNNIYGKDNEELYLAALLHDVGHAPFSHTSDELLKKYLGKTHEIIGEEKIREGRIKDIISGAGLSFARFVKYFRGEGFGEIFAGTFGADRIDYLSRDAYYAGVNYGVIDQQRLKYKLGFYKGRLSIYDYDISVAESMLIARYLMFYNVYKHHTGLIVSGMYNKAASAAIDNGEVDFKTAKDYDDLTFITELSKTKSAGEIVGRILERRLYKRAVYLDSDSVKSDTERDIKGRLEKAGEKEYVVITAKIKKSGDDVSVIDKKGNYVGTLSELSPIVRSLNEVIGRKTILLVACSEDRVEKVKRIAEKSL
jgi:HD superfamily phosphohydrolase